MVTNIGDVALRLSPDGLSVSLRTRGEGSGFKFPLKLDTPSPDTPVTRGVRSGTRSGAATHPGITPGIDRCGDDATGLRGHDAVMTSASFSPLVARLSDQPPIIDGIGLQPRRK
jgi:hypothetical protein